MSCFCKFDHVHSFKVRATNSTNAYASVSFLARTIVTGTSCEHNLHQSVWSRALRSFTGLVRHSLHVVYWETDICGHDSCRVTVKMVTQCNARRSNHSIPTLHSRRVRRFGVTLQSFQHSVFMRDNDNVSFIAWSIRFVSELALCQECLLSGVAFTA